MLLNVSIIQIQYGQSGKLTLFLQLKVNGKMENHSVTSSSKSSSGSLKEADHVSWNPPRQPNDGDIYTHNGIRWRWDEISVEWCRQFVEADPLGKDAHSPGAKLDAGKNDLDLVLGAFAGALLEVGKVGTYGAQKYTRHGWRSVPNGINRYSSALLRHYFAEATELRDKDTDLLHAAHLAWNALARLQLMLDMTIPKENHEPQFESNESLPSTQQTLARFFKSSPQVQQLFILWADRNLSIEQCTAWKKVLSNTV